MKKIYLSLFLFTTCLHLFAQSSLRSAVMGSNGVSKHFVEISPSESINFSSADFKTALGLPGQSDFVLIEKFTDDQGYLFYRYYQAYLGIPIENSMCIVHTKNNRITALAGSFILNFSAVAKHTATEIGKTSAIEKATAFVGAKKYAWDDSQMENAIQISQGNPSATYRPNPSTVWYNNGSDLDPHSLRVAYKVDIYSIEPLDRKYVFIDAETGKVLGTSQILHHTDATGTANTVYSGTQTIHSDLNSGTYRLRDITKGNGVITLHGETGIRGTEYTSTSANWNLAGANRYALDAHYGVSNTYAFYKSNFNRNSVNNAGLALTSYVNCTGVNENNGAAYWDGNVMNFGNVSGTGAGFTAIDITGHELTHGVTQYTSQLVYSNESGAINESMSDIMGKSVQFWAKPTDINWQLGNDMPYIIRNMANPNAFGQPDTYHGTSWYSGSNNDIAVHTNSGVGNFMFFLLVTGGTGTNDIGNAYNVTGIGLAQADQIIYKTEISGLGPNSTYADWRTASINAATTLYGANSCQVISVTNAWYAVGVGAAYVISPSYAQGTASVCVGANSSFTLTNLPAGSTVTWSSGNTNYVTVSASGNPTTLHGVATGNAVITANITSSCAGTKTYTFIATSGNPTPNGTSSVTGYNGTNNFPVLNTSLSAIGPSGYTSSFTYNINDSRFSGFSWTLVSQPSGSSYSLGNANKSLFTSVKAPTTSGQTNTETLHLNATGPCGAYSVDFNSSAAYVSGVGGRQFAMSPNPASGNVTIQEIDELDLSASRDNKVTITIINQGLVVLKQYKFAKSRTYPINVSDLKPGVYTVHVVEDGNISTMQLIRK